jgi:hypothetical protein
MSLRLTVFKSLVLIAQEVKRFLVQQLGFVEVRLGYARALARFPNSLARWYLPLRLHPENKFFKARSPLPPLGILRLKANLICFGDVQRMMEFSGIEDDGEC